MVCLYIWSSFRLSLMGGRVIQYIFMKDVVAGAALRVSVSRHEH